ncbi:MAG TPA: hypothetical protein VHW43_09960 [Puia sp.]|nr:hypothetical protein [Puia sp.]
MNTKIFLPFSLNDILVFIDNAFSQVDILAFHAFIFNQLNWVDFEFGLSI